MKEHKDLTTIAMRLKCKIPQMIVTPQNEPDASSLSESQRWLKEPSVCQRLWDSMHSDKHIKIAHSCFTVPLCAWLVTCSDSPSVLESRGFVVELLEWLSVTWFCKSLHRFFTTVFLLWEGTSKISPSQASRHPRICTAAKILQLSHTAKVNIIAILRLIFKAEEPKTCPLLKNKVKQKWRRGKLSDLKNGHWWAFPK